MIDVDNPLEPFKRATTAAIRAIAENDELDVNFGPGAPTAFSFGVLSVPPRVQHNMHEARIMIMP